MHSDRDDHSYCNYFDTGWSIKLLNEPSKNVGKHKSVAHKEFCEYSGSQYGNSKLACFRSRARRNWENW